MPYKQEEYYLKYKDTKVLGFNTNSMEVWMVNLELLPVQFQGTLDALKKDYKDIFYYSVYNDILKLYHTVISQKFKQFFLQYKTIEEFQEMAQRIEKVLK